MTDKHLSTQFDAELSSISARVLEMGGLVESQVAQAVHALATFSGDIATLVLEQEQRDGRFRDEQARAGQDATRRSYVNQHRFGNKDVAQWLEKQVYLALGTALVGAATLEIDATPMEGFDQKILDAEFGLNEKGLAGLVLVSFGYSSEKDFNAGLPNRA